MKRKTIALMTALTLVFSLSACGKKTALQADMPDTASVKETAETTEEKVQSAIGEMPYYGDTASCKMTAEQATAYAQLIADGLAGDFSFRGRYDEEIFSIISWSEPFHINQVDAYINEYETNRSNVIVGDFSGEGIPYLYIFSNTEPSSFEVYGWNNNKTALVCSEEKYLRGNSSLSEQNDGTIKVVKEYFNTEVQCGDEYWWAATLWNEYDFTEGSLKQIYERALAKPDPLDNSGMFYIVENGEQTGEVADGEYEAYIEKETHQHTLPYTCFYDMTPCTLEEMVNYLNAYASVMSDGQSAPVEIKIYFYAIAQTGLFTGLQVPKGIKPAMEYERTTANAFYESGVITAAGKYLRMKRMKKSGIWPKMRYRSMNVICIIRSFTGVLICLTILSGKSISVETGSIFWSRSDQRGGKYCIVTEKISGTPVSYHGIMLTQKGTVSRKEQVEKQNGKAGRKTDKWERV